MVVSRHRLLYMVQRTSTLTGTLANFLNSSTSAAPVTATPWTSVSSSSPVAAVSVSSSAPVAPAPYTTLSSSAVAPVSAAPYPSSNGTSVAPVGTAAPSGYASSTTTGGPTHYTGAASKASVAGAGFMAMFGLVALL